MRPSKARHVALLLALGLGVLGDLLLRVPGTAGLNLALWAAAGIAAVAILRPRRERLSLEVTMLLGSALLFSAAIAWRDAPALRAVNVLMAAMTAALAGGAGAEARLRRAGLLEYPWACLTSGFSAVAGPVGLVGGTPDSRPGRARSRHALAVLRGALIAAPLLVVFGSLLVAADPVFEHLVETVFAFDPAEILSHAVLIGVLAWGSAGYLSRFIDASPVVMPPLSPPRPRVGLVEGAVALGLLNVLFLAFVAVQLRYLFGGADLVAVTPGLGFAQYARRGFFELVAVVALVLPVLLLADWTVRREGWVQQWVFRGFATGQVLLLFAILASALYRMRLYRQMYGLTEQRVYTSVFMVWIAFVLVWFAATVLVGRRQRFAFGALTSGLAAAFLLNVVNPDALIARVNADRAAAGQPYDAVYAGRLSGDAVPVLVASLDALPALDRCRIAHVLLEEWLPDRHSGWRTFNYGDWRARRAVDQAEAKLQARRCELVKTGP